MANSSRKRQRGGKLTEQQERFSREYIIDLNGSEAAIRSGCPKASAKVSACRWLAMPHVAARVAELQKKVAAKQEITAERVLAELAKIGFREMHEIGGVVKCSDKTHALELLGKHLQLFTDKVQFMGDDSFVRILEAARQRVKK